MIVWTIPVTMETVEIWLVASTVHVNQDILVKPVIKVSL